MDQQQLRDIEYRCIQEEQPFCTAACPIHVDVRAFMAALAKGDVRAARKVLDRTMPFVEIVGRLCDHPCESHCIRKEIGDPLAIGALERFCVSNSDTVVKLPKLPAKGGKVAVIGAGLSGMTAALDLARKGRPTTLFTTRTGVGGSLRSSPETLLPARTLIDAAALLTGYGVGLNLGVPLDQEAIGTVLGGYDAVYIDRDEIDFALLPFAATAPDPLTLALAREGCFAGGGVPENGSFSVIKQVEDGRRAALSIERFLQKVSLTAQRDKEGACATRLVTVTKYYAPAPRISPADPASGYTAAEARAEAGRCIHCECLECVKQCVYLREYQEYPKTLARKIYNNLAIVQGTRNANRMINSCSLCSQCTVICPHDFPTAQVCRTTRAAMVESNHMPPSAHDFALEDMRFSVSEHCTLSRHQPGTTASRYLFYPGCQLAGSAPDAVRRTYRYLTGALDGGVGLLLGCCGIPAHWAGQQELFRRTLQAFRSEVERLGQPQVIVACISCLAIFKEMTPEVEAISLWQVLDALELPIPPQPLPASPLTLHDPCTARHQPELRQSVRNLCAKLGLAIAEMEFGGELTDCCGYGGLMQMANPPLGAKAARVKAERSRHDGLAYCAMCRDNLAATGTRVAHLLDYCFPGPEPGDPLSRKNPGFSGRHENRARLKTELLTTLWGESAGPTPARQPLQLLLDEEVRERLDSRRILEEDVRQVIHRAETLGQYLVNPDNHHRLASFRPVRVTYWVEYEPTDQGYRVHNGYSHRMQLPEDAP